MATRDQWNQHVYRTDQERKYIGFFVDQDGAEAWIAKQKEGTYEVSTQPPVRTAVVAPEPESEEPSGDADAPERGEDADASG